VSATHEYPSSDTLDLLCQVTRDVARSRRLSPDDAEDFAQTVHLRLLEREYDVLRQFNGQSSLRTYLTVVVNRMLLDWRNATWGKWRASAAARRLGEAAVALERLIHRDGFTANEAVEMLRSTRHAPSADDLRRLLDTLPPRVRRRTVPDDEARETCAIPFEDPVDAAERQRTGRTRRMALRAALRQLPADDRRLVHLRYHRGHSVQAISRALHMDPKHLYRRFDRVRRTLRQSVARSGAAAHPSSTAGSGSTSCVRSTITLRTTTASETSATTPATKTTRMLRAPTSPARTGLAATPIN
jgi:RNA polymerase sigma factor (sigma-70 family)